MASVRCTPGEWLGRWYSHALIHLQTTCGADGKIIVWDISGDGVREEKVIEGVIPAVADTE